MRGYLNEDKMGVALFLFKSLTLQREKSSLNLRLAQLGRKRIRLTHSASAKARAFSSERRELRNWLNSQLDGLRSGEASRTALEGGSTSPRLGLCFCRKWK